jgi:D-inositol-3-phosphate glycosyltransferase
MGRRPARLLIAGYARGASGFARVCHGIAGHLPEHYEVHQLGVDVHGQEPVDVRGAHRRWRVHSNPDPDDPWGLAELPRLVASLSPDLVLMNAPPAALAAMCHTLTSARCALVGYPAIGAREEVWGLHLGQFAALDRLVLYTRFARECVESIAAAAGIGVPNLDVIPHGIDHDCFHALVSLGKRPARAASRRQARAVLFPNRPELDDALIVLNANQNQPHKRVDLTVAGFAAFARDRGRDVYLYLHMGLRLGARSEPLGIEKAGLADRILLTELAERHPTASDERLNVIYNACDIGVNTSTSEGWGLCAFEHAATGAAQVLTATAVISELWTGAAELVRPTRRAAPGRPLSVAAEDVAEALSRLCDNRQRLDTLSDAAWARATRSEYQWTAVAERWDNLFQDVLAAA